MWGVVHGHLSLIVEGFSKLSKMYYVHPREARCDGLDEEEYLFDVFYDLLQVELDFVYCDRHLWSGA